MGAEGPHPLPQGEGIGVLLDRGHQGVEDFVDEALGVFVHLGVRAVLHWMRDEDSADLFESEAFGLVAGGLDELRGGDEDAGLALQFEEDGVVHTARRAGSSISERFDDEVALLQDRIFDRLRGRLGDGRLHEAPRLDAGRALVQ